MTGPASDIVLGIDLGTTNSVVAVADGKNARVLADADGQRLIPSVVSFPDEGPALVGELARERRLVDAENTVYAIKRLIGRPFDSPEVARAMERFAFHLVEGENRGVRVQVRGETWSLAEISAYVLRECRRVAEQMLGETITKAVITVPANFNELQRSATKAAGKVAGLEVLRILNEPTAAAVAYGYGARGAERVAVYDFGGGTFDLTVLDLDEDVFEVVATAGDTFLGGDDIDLEVAERMADAFVSQHDWDPRQDRQAFERLRAAAEWAKCTLSFEESATARVAELAVGSDGRPLDLDFTFTREDLDAIVLPLANRSLRVCAEAMRVGTVEKEQIDRVVLVGGSTRIPLVRRMVTNFFEREPQVDIDPDLVVALGAAMQAYALSAKKPRDTLSILPGPSRAQAEAIQKKKAEARAGRPEQPAFRPDVPAVLMGLDDLDTGAEADPAPDREAPDLPHLPVPSVTPAEAEPQAYRPPTPGGAPAPPVPAAGEPSVAIEPEYQSQVDSMAPPAPDAPAFELDFEGLGLEEPFASRAQMQPAAPPRSEPPEELDFGDLDIDFDAPPEPPPPPAAPPPPPPPAIEPAPVLTLEDVEPPPTSAPAPSPAPTLPREGDSIIPMPDRAPPLLMDVTPHSLGIETAGGYCEHIIGRNAPIPVEQARVFTTAQDDQETVRISVCQGESRVFEENQPLGELELTGLRQARRGQVPIRVLFLLDADGTLDVRAVDVQTDREQRTRIALLGGYGEAEVEEMRARQEA